MVRGGLAPRGFWEWVQGVGLIVWVNTRPMVCDSPSARSAVAREARFICEYFVSDVFFSFLWETCGPNVFRGDFHDSFALDLQVKDIRLFVEMAKQANVSTIFHILLGNYSCSPYFAKLHCFLPPEGQRCIEFTTRTS